MNYITPLSAIVQRTLGFGLQLKHFISFCLIFFASSWITNKLPILEINWGNGLHFYKLQAFFFSISSYNTIGWKVEIRKSFRFQELKTLQLHRKIAQTIKVISLAISKYRKQEMSDFGEVWRYMYLWIRKKAIAQSVKYIFFVRFWTPTKNTKTFKWIKTNTHRIDLEWMEVLQKTAVCDHKCQLYHGPICNNTRCLNVAQYTHYTHCEWDRTKTAEALSRACTSWYVPCTCFPISMEEDTHRAVHSSKFVIHICRHM